MRLNLEFSHRWAQDQHYADMKSRGQYDNNDKVSSKSMVDVFCNASMIDNTPYMARGIYVDGQGIDQNHTFCAIGHRYDGCYSFSIIECVTSILVLNEKTTVECKRIEKAIASKYDTLTPMHVLNKEEMQKKYKYILWVGQYMVFECIQIQGPSEAPNNAYISFGASSYYEYTGAYLRLHIHINMHIHTPAICLACLSLHHCCFACLCLMGICGFT